LQAASLKPPIELVRKNSFADTFTDPDVDAAMFVASLRRELTPLLRDGAYRLIPVTNANALAVDLFDVRISEIPAGVYGSNLSAPEKPLQKLAVDTNIFVRADVPDLVVRELTKALFTYHVQSAARLPVLNEATARDDADLELHPAAASYYSRSAPVSVDQFEIAAFGLAALLTVLSAGRWLVSWVRARKLRINQRAVSDILYAIGETAVSSSDVPETRGREVADLLRESQRRWLAGRIDDEELRMISDAAAAYTGHRYDTHRNTRVE